jgi:hypothetical protein
MRAIQGLQTSATVVEAQHSHLLPSCFLLASQVLPRCFPGSSGTVVLSNICMSVFDRMTACACSSVIWQDSGHRSARNSITLHSMAPGPFIIRHCVALAGKRTFESTRPSIERRKRHDKTKEDSVFAAKAAIPDHTGCIGHAVPGKNKGLRPD